MVNVCIPFNHPSEADVKVLGPAASRRGFLIRDSNSRVVVLIDDHSRLRAAKACQDVVKKDHLLGSVDHCDIFSFAGRECDEILSARAPGDRAMEHDDVSFLRAASFKAASKSSITGSP